MARLPPPSRPLAALLLACWLMAGGTVSSIAADDPGRDLKRTEKALEAERAERQRLEREAAAVAAELESLRSDMVAAARDLQDGESTASAHEDRLAELDAEAKAKRDQLMRRREQFSGVLIALERMARYPPEALFALPWHPSDMVRGAILLRAAAPRIQANTSTLRDELASLAETRRRITEEREHLKVASANLAGERGRLDKLLARKRALHANLVRQEQEAARRIDELAARSRDLRDLMERLEREAQARRKAEEEERRNRRAAVTRAPAGQPFSRARGALPFPVRGRILTRYGENVNQGLTSKGLSIETRPGAQVVATYDGKVVFAGKFRGYGQLLIIEHGEGYHSLLSGMERIDATPGQSVVAGEPVAVMEAAAGQRPVLYLELRRDSQPINPLPWLAARKGKTNG